MQRRLTHKATITLFNIWLNLVKQGTSKTIRFGHSLAIKLPLVMLLKIELKKKPFCWVTPIKAVNSSRSTARKMLKRKWVLLSTSTSMRKPISTCLNLPMSPNIKLIKYDSAIYGIDYRFTLQSQVRKEFSMQFCDSAARHFNWNSAITFSLSCHRSMLRESGRKRHCPRSHIKCTKIFLIRLSAQSPRTAFLRHSHWVWFGPLREPSECGGNEQQ